jgi:hypothetical protein
VLKEASWTPAYAARDMEGASMGDFFRGVSWGASMSRAEAIKHLARCYAGPDDDGVGVALPPVRKPKAAKARKAVEEEEDERPIGWSDAEREGREGDEPLLGSPEYWKRYEEPEPTRRKRR